MKYYYRDTHNVVIGALIANLLREKEETSGKAKKKVDLVNSSGNAVHQFLISGLGD